jgi:hypothetical protein
LVLDDLDGPSYTFLFIFGHFLAAKVVIFIVVVVVMASKQGHRHNGGSGRLRSPCL